MVSGSNTFIVNVVLLASLVIIGVFHIAQGLEYFDAMTNTDLRSIPAPFEGGTSVFSSLPKQNNLNAAWKYYAPYQSTCMSPSCSSGCRKGQKMICSLTPHNQRNCYWQWYKIDLFFFVTKWYNRVKQLYAFHHEHHCYRPTADTLHHVFFDQLWDTLTRRRLE